MILLLAGCAFGPGRPLVELAGADLSLAFDPGARADEGRVLTDLGATWRPTAFELDVASLDLEELQGAEGVSFDPANPPAGYSLCHGGHCHAADGSLVDYSEIEAELAGGNAALVVLAGWPVDASFDVLDSVERSFGAPADLLPESTLTRAVLRLDAIRLTGDLAADGVDALPFAVELGPTEVGADLGFEVDRDAPAAVRVVADWTLDGTLLDGVDVPTEVAAGTLEATLTEIVRDRLALQPLSATLKEVP